MRWLCLLERKEITASVEIAQSLILPSLSITFFFLYCKQRLITCPQAIWCLLYLQTSLGCISGGSFQPICLCLSKPVKRGNFEKFYWRQQPRLYPARRPSADMEKYWKNKRGEINSLRLSIRVVCWLNCAAAGVDPALCLMSWTNIEKKTKQKNRFHFYFSFHYFGVISFLHIAVEMKENLKARWKESQARHKSLANMPEWLFPSFLQTSTVAGVG